MKKNHRQLNLDDFYFNGEGFVSSECDLRYLMRKYPYTFIVGMRGVGKGILGKTLSLYNKNHLFIESQQLRAIRIELLKRAKKVIEIKEVDINRFLTNHSGVHDGE